MNEDTVFDKNYYINVKELMTYNLPYPKHRSRFIVNYDEILPIITVECDVWE